MNGVKIKVLLFIILMSLLNFNNSSANYEKLFYDFKIKSIKGNEIDLAKFKGKTVLMVNVASKCGFTKQYEGLQDLWSKYKKRGLIVLGVPSNQFGNQEPGTEKEIKEFCEVNFNINFPMTSKVDVKGENAHEIYKWALKNYGKSAVPKWNFHKILINSEGKIEETYMSFTKPNSQKIINKIEKLLN